MVININYKSKKKNMVINRSIFHLSCEIFHKCVNECFSGKKEIRIVSKLEKQKSELVEVGSKMG